MNRKSWEHYFLEISQLVAKRSTCIRRKVGAVIVKDKHIIATGYNGVPSGIDHCIDTGCLRDKLNIPSGEHAEKCSGLHAEQNAIIQAAVHGVSIRDSTLYCTHQPCNICAKMIVNAKIKEVYFKEDYPDPQTLALFKKAKIQVYLIA